MFFGLETTSIWGVFLAPFMLPSLPPFVADAGFPDPANCFFNESTVFCSILVNIGEG